MDEIICAICDKPITGEDYDNRHLLHEKWCESYHEDDDGEPLECDCTFIQECHAECCPDCKKERESK